MHETKPVQKRIALLLVGILGFIFVLLGRIAWIQFVDGQRMAEKMKAQLRETKTLYSPRGTIYDRNGRELAISAMRKSLYADPAEISADKAELARLLAPLLEMNPADIEERLGADNRFVWLKRTVEPEVSAAVHKLIKEKNITGLYFLEESKRYYPNASLAAHVLGFVGTDDVGLDGIEMSYDSLIRGGVIKKPVDTDSRGIPIFDSIYSGLPPAKSTDIYLTLDATIQLIAENTLDKVMRESKAKAATVVIINPRTGEVLAMANRPTYNPNYFYRYGPGEWRNRAVAFVYEPGSTFKAMVAAAGMQEGLVSPEERFQDAGQIEVGGIRVKNWDGEGHGSISFSDIIKNSINTGFVETGVRLGSVRLIEYTRQFGFGKTTDIQLPGEEHGLLFDPKTMRPSDIASMSIGQGIAVTPIQLVTAMAAIANNGILLKPHIVKEIRADGMPGSVTPVESIRQVISPETAHSLTALLERVVAEGGGVQAAVQGYRFAGKTGTAEKLKQGGAGYETGRYIASFAGFGPVEDPQIAALVVVDDPVGAYYGGQVAAPIFREIITEVMWYLTLRKQAGTPVGEPPEANLADRSQSLDTAGMLLPEGKVLVPDVRGKTIREAGMILNNAGLAFIPAGSGKAVAQSPQANTKVQAGTEVTVNFESR